MSNKQKFQCNLMNFSINRKNFSVYKTKNYKIIKFETATKSKNVAKMSNQEYSDFIDDLQEKFGYYAFDNIATFNYLCDKFN